MATDFLPLDGQSLNYTQIFFRWPQVVDADSYQITINNDNRPFPEVYNADQNSIIIEVSNWGEQYYWDICGIDIDNEYLDCFDQLSFTINDLPSFYPENVYILTANIDQMHPGVSIIDYESQSFSVAVKNDGSPIWFSDRNNFPTSKIVVTEISSNGNFIGFGFRRGYEFDVNSNIVFETQYPEYGVHHSIIKTDQSYFFLDAITETLPCPAECSTTAPENLSWVGDRIIEVDLEGNLLWEWSTFDYFSELEYNPQWIPQAEVSGDFDWTHANSVFFDKNDEIVYVSFRNINRISAIDYNSKELLWDIADPSYMAEVPYGGNFEFSHQHSAQITNSGSLIFFDNGRDSMPERSKCMEIEIPEFGDPQLVWEYTLPDSMFTLSRGECKRLGNGNTLITAGRSGNIIEVNTEGEIVWHLRATNEANVNVGFYWSQRIPNIYPNEFSLEINNLQGEYLNYSIVEENSNFTIHNLGWETQSYIYELWGNDSLLNQGSRIIQSNSSDAIYFDIDNLNVELNYSLKVYTENRPGVIQEINFTSIFLLGDLNSDLVLDVLDIVIMVNVIMGHIEDMGNSDMNSDGLINVLDIVQLVNIILND
ncbi:MAG: aryl-sulfate sulfotransferase [Candidatus Marinimicrobia bacterium]|nr:aryl-sulfate sulfotransferase [Candidatus Neomarinimicrobiota bacterium]